MGCDRGMRWLLTVLIALAAGCGGGGGGAGAEGGAPRPDGGHNPVADAAITGKADGARPADAATAPAADAGPPASRRLVAGRARLTGTHANACSHQPGSAERWCAFSLPSQTIGKTELWVIDATRALVGDVPCDGSSPGCLRLSGELWTGTPRNPPHHPYSHRFFGDTLIFYAGTAPDVAVYDGPIFGWRPGWPAARQLTGAHAFSCDGQVRTDVAVCIENVTTMPGMPAQFDLHAGRLGTTPLPTIAHVFPARPDGSFQSDAGFSAAGDYFAYSTGGATLAEPETLYVYRSDDLGTAARRVTVGANISRWDISADGKRWYYYRNFNYPAPGSGIQGTGTLVTADFPGGGNEAMIAPGVATYQALSEAGADRGVAFLDTATGATATYKIVRDPSKPTQITTVSAGVGGFVVSPDLRFSVLQTQFNATLNTSDLTVIKNDGTGRCTLAPMATVDDLLLTPFSPRAGLVFWIDNVNAMSGLGEGWLANPDGCTGKQKFADAVDIWFPMGESGLVYSDGGNGTITNLRYAKFGPGPSWPASGPVTIREHAGFVYAPLDGDWVVYHVALGTTEDGLYAYGPMGLGRP